ncbi:tRNA preQ1(34) S-adenosylmethionine ribosyltransferase-isomerase QueA [Helicobacter aurati]|uniref:tRNA preQ1(34) S-adenosylmethionine ribosyltransferase-isomerase QueA n=1 Tax=Helicobacter aurati TaxID=137778 RepID=A0A3D8J8A8_9HELI|nr:tRNA preQ1(34) S-adenosylmethionine ribosyltransferase-isomerase QueA [Helicobacter aurati]RDU73739.1 tRNA preQ1(34) S-adenosylmethionine ribosyltransferase-isomerase QueA [Helicobacter aurati]
MNKDLLLSSYCFSLPKNLIATTPVYPKESARLLVYHKDTQKITHTYFEYLFDFVPRDYLIVLNNTKVIHARFYASKLANQSTIQMQNTSKEFLYHKSLGNTKHLVQIRGRASVQNLFLANDLQTLIELSRVCDDGYREVVFYKMPAHVTTLRVDSREFLTNLQNKTIMQDSEVMAFLQRYGKIPLPPYIKRKVTRQDYKDYQSIFADINGSIAAPTASLHFSESMLTFLQQHYNYTFVTLHVGAGTFAPLQVSSILEHKIHSEYCNLTQESAQKIMQHNNILCVGTTALRCVEWFANLNGLSLDKNVLHSMKYSDWQLSGENTLFLHPFNRPRVVRALLTNFHLPQSSLLLLVSSLIGREEMLRIYAEAIQKEYRFYSYGDGMLIV